MTINPLTPAKPIRSILSAAASRLCAEMRDRLAEDEEIGAARAGEVILDREGVDWIVRCEDFDIIFDWARLGVPSALVRQMYVEQHGPAKVKGVLTVSCSTPLVCTIQELSARRCRHYIQPLADATSTGSRCRLGR